MSKDNKSSIKKAFGIFKEAFKNDPQYAWSWHCNIAMAAYDQGLNQKSANKAAANFMTICFGVDTSQSKEYKELFKKSQNSTRIEK